MTRGSDVIKAERSTRTDRVKLEETGEAGKEIMKMSAPGLGSDQACGWIPACLLTDRIFFFSNLSQENQRC